MIELVVEKDKRSVDAPSHCTTMDESDGRLRTSDVLSLLPPKEIQKKAPGGVVVVSKGDSCVCLDQGLYLTRSSVD